MFWNNDFSVAFNIFAHAMVFCGGLFAVCLVIGLVRQIYFWYRLTR